MVNFKNGHNAAGRGAGRAGNKDDHETETCEFNLFIRENVMKKLVCMFAVIALAAPLYAADPNVVISCDDEGNGVCVVKYEVLQEDGDPGLVRGFAFDVTLSGNATIESIYDYSSDGTSVGTPSEYGVFIGSIDFGSDPNNVDDWDDPVADPCDPGTAGTIPGGAITVELASLYDPDTEPGKAPGTTGVLFRLELAANGDADTTVTITPEDTRGGIVMENVASATLVSSGCTVTFDCFPQDGIGGITAYNDWVAFGKPDCWCWTRQCHGDADNASEGSSYAGWIYVGANDLTVMSTAWLIKEPPKGLGIGTIPGAICADFDHAKEGSSYAGWIRVGANDLTLMAQQWLVKEPPKGTGVPADCPL